MKTIYRNRWLPWALFAIFFAFFGVWGIIQFDKLASDIDNLENSLISVPKHQINLLD